MMISKEGDLTVYNFLANLLNIYFEDKATFELSTESYYYNKLTKFNIQACTKHNMIVTNKSNNKQCKFDLDSGVIDMDCFKDVLEPCSQLILAQALVFVLNKTVRLIEQSRVICLFELPDKVECEDSSVRLSESTIEEMITLYNDRM